MQSIFNHARRALLLLITAIVAGCGGSGDEYDGFEATVSSSTPNRFLTFFNRQGDLPAGKYTLVVATNVAAQAGTFSVTIERNDGSPAQIINGRWTSSGGTDPDPACASGNKCLSAAVSPSGTRATGSCRPPGP